MPAPRRPLQQQMPSPPENSQDSLDDELYTKISVVISRQPYREFCLEANHENELAIRKIPADLEDTLEHGDVLVGIENRSVPNQDCHTLRWEFFTAHVPFTATFKRLNFVPERSVSYVLERGNPLPIPVSQPKQQQPQLVVSDLESGSDSMGGSEFSESEEMQNHNFALPELLSNHFDAQSGNVGSVFQDEEIVEGSFQNRSESPPPQYEVCVAQVNRHVEPTAPPPNLQEPCTDAFTPHISHLDRQLACRETFHAPKKSELYRQVSEKFYESKDERFINITRVRVIVDYIDNFDCSMVAYPELEVKRSSLFASSFRQLKDFMWRKKN